MASGTADRPYTINANKIGAIVAQGASLATTFWLLEWIAKPSTQADYVWTWLFAFGLEFIFIRMKACLFDASAGNDVVGWLGFIFDSITNAGGIFPIGARIITWPPLATLLLAVEIDASNQRTQQIGTLIVALALGGVLSMLPFRLWMRGNRSSKE